MISVVLAFDVVELALTGNVEVDVLGCVITSDAELVFVVVVVVTVVVDVVVVVVVDVVLV